MSEAQLDAYERFWMNVNDEEAFIETKYYESRAEERIANAQSLKENGVPIDVIAKSLSLTDEELCRQLIFSSLSY